MDHPEDANKTLKQDFHIKRQEQGVILQMRLFFY